MFLGQYLVESQLYRNKYPEFNNTTDTIDTYEEVAEKLDQFDPTSGRLAVKKQNGERSLVIIPNGDYNLKNRFLSIFGMGKLAHTQSDLHSVCEYLSNYKFKEHREEHELAYQRVCEIAGRFLLAPKESTYKQVLKQYESNPSKLSTLHLWIKNSDAVEESFNEDDPAEERTFTCYSNPAMEAEHRELMRKLYIQSHPRMDL